MKSVTQPSHAVTSFFADPFSWLNRPDDLIRPLGPMMRSQQLFWSMGLKVYQQELEFIRICQLKSLEMGQCLCRLPADMESAGATHQSLGNIMTDVHKHATERLQQLKSLNDELKDAIWEEL